MCASTHTHTTAHATTTARAHKHGANVCAVEVVSSNQKIKDGRTVRQLLIDTYAENEKKDREEGHGGHAGNNGQQSLETDNTELEKASIKDMKKGDRKSV